MQVLGWFILVQNRPGQPYYLGDVVKPSLIECTFPFVSDGQTQHN